MPIESNPREGAIATAPTLRFLNWGDAEQYFRAKEADPEIIETAHSQLASYGTAVMTIV
jgi:hypothetical protein